MGPRRIMFTMAMATVLLGALVGVASARNFSTTSQALRAAWSRYTWSSGAGTIECPLTLEGSLHSRTIAKVVNTLMGYINRAILGTCIRGQATILTATLPWHRRYAGFTGTLGAIGQVISKISGSAIQIREPTFGITCLMSGGIPQETFTREAGGALTSSALSGTSPSNCGTTMTLSSSSGTVSVAGAGTRITLTLI